MRRCGGRGSGGRIISGCRKIIGGCNKKGNFSSSFVEGLEKCGGRFGRGPGGGSGGGPGGGPG